MDVRIPDDDDMAVYRAIVEAARQGAEVMPDYPEMALAYKRLLADFESGNWDAFERIEDETGGGTRDELHRQAEEQRLRTGIEHLRSENERLRAALREVVSAAGVYLAEHGIHGFRDSNMPAEDALVGIKDAAESALKA